MSASLNLWLLPVRGESPRAAVERLLLPFLRENPALTIHIRVVPWSTMWDRLMSVLKGHPLPDGPDVIQADLAWVGTLAALGLLKELPAGLRGDGAAPAALWEPCAPVPSKRLYAAPWTVDVRILLYRARAVADAGFSPADLDRWEGLAALGRAVAAQRRRLFRPRAGGESALTELAPWVWSAGGRFFSPDERRAAFLEPEGEAAFAFYQTLAAAGRDARGEPVLATDSLGAPPAPGWAAAPMPRGAAGRVTALAGTALALPAGSRHAEAAEALLRHLLSPAMRRDFARAAGLLAGAPEDDAGREAWSAARLPPPVALLGSFERLFHRHLAPLINGAADWADWRQALALAARETDVLLTHYEPAAA